MPRLTLLLGATATVLAVMAGCRGRPAPHYAPRQGQPYRHYGRPSTTPQAAPYGGSIPQTQPAPGAAVAPQGSSAGSSNQPPTPSQPPRGQSP